MECSTVSIDCDEYCQEISSTRPVSRKEHKCGECRRTIFAGEKYERYVGKNDKMFVHKTCSDCLVLRDVFFSDGYYFGGLWEQMEEHIRECWYDISESTIEKLGGSTAQGKVCDLIAEGWEDDE